ncbi:restriction endonuclease subunit S [Vibrio cholerae]
MSSNWTRYRLEELGDIVTGKTPPSKVQNAFSDSGTQFVTPRDMDGRRWIDSTERFLSESGVAAVKNSLIPPGSVAVSCIGSDMGKAVLLKVESVTNQQINTLVVDTQKFNPKFVYYVLSTKQAEFKSIAGGSATPILNKGHFGKFEINLPTKDEQDCLVRCLDSLDSKIENNAQTNQTLEQIAQAIFKSWFVDFDPVKAKIEALAAGGSADDAELAAISVISAKTLDELNSLKASNPEAFNKLAQTAALFPAAMQDSELGEIPEGWEVKQLKDILELAYGKALKKTDRVDGDVPVYGSGGLTGYHNQSLVEGPGIIVGRKGTVGSVYWEPKAFYPIDTVFYVKPRAGYSLKYCHLVLQNLGLKDMNTDAAVPGLNRDNAYRLDVITPTKGVMNLFKEIMQSLQSNVDANNAQSASLESLRDTLLPKLLSGEIDLTSEVVE